jgi:hypothetical protein
MVMSFAVFRRLSSIFEKFDIYLFKLKSLCGRYKTTCFFTVPLNFKPVSSWRRCLGYIYENNESFDINGCSASHLHKDKVQNFNLVRKNSSVGHELTPWYTSWWLFNDAASETIYTAKHDYECSSVRIHVSKAYTRAKMSVCLLGSSAVTTHTSLSKFQSSVLPPSSDG